MKAIFKMCWIIAPLLLTMMSLFCFPIQGEEAEIPELTVTPARFQLLGWSDKNVYISLDFTSKAELNVFKAPSPDDSELKPVKRVNLPGRLTTWALIHDCLYLTDSRNVMYYHENSDTEGLDNNLTDLVRGGRCAISKEGLLAVVTSSRLQVYDIKGKPCSQEFGIVVDPNTTSLYWADENSVVIHDESGKTAIVVTISSGAITIYPGIYFVHYKGCGLFDIGIENEYWKEYKDTDIVSEPLIVRDGRFRKYPADWYNTGKWISRNQDDVICILSDSKAAYYRNGELIHSSYTAAKIRMQNCITSGNWQYGIAFTDTHILQRDNESGRIFSRPNDSEGSITFPTSVMVCADLETKDGALSMLFADGTWMKVSASDWKPVSSALHSALAGDIYTTAPQGRSIAVSTRKISYAINQKGELRMMPIRPGEDSNILYEQGGSRIAVVKDVTSLVSVKQVTQKLNAHLYDLSDWYENDNAPQFNGRTKVHKFRNDDCISSWWRAVNFIGETGELFMYGKDECEVLPEGAQPLQRPDFRGPIRNMVWAGGLLVTNDKIYRLRDAAEINVKIPSEPDYEYFVPSWRLPGTKCALFLSICKGAENDRICAVNLSPQNGQEEVFWLDVPKGTRWIARDGGDILCISAFGRLLGRIDIPEWFIEK